MMAISFLHHQLLPKLCHRPLLNHLSLPSVTYATFSRIFQYCSKHRDLDAGLRAHAKMATSGFVPTTFVGNCLIHMYLRCSNLDYARKVFDHMPSRDTISWNAIIWGYAQNGFLDFAKLMFDAMPEQDIISWNSLVSGCLQNGLFYDSVGLFLQMIRKGIDVDETTFSVILKSLAALEALVIGVQVHGMTVKVGLDHHVVTGSALLDMYAKCESSDESICFFDEMPEKNWVTWSAVIGGCVHNGKFIAGLKLFIEMQRSGVGVSQAAYASAFRSCAGMSSCEIGSQLHGHAFKYNFSTDCVVGTAIMDMYAKTDCFNDAMRVFQCLPIVNTQTWNAAIVGSARNNQALKALELFLLMQKSNVGFDEISLSGVLSACAELKGNLQGKVIHCLAIKTGFISDICVSNAILDMYGKCNALAEAYNLFQEMNKRDSVSWNAVITALEQNGQFESTLLHFYQMLHYGMEPDEFTFGSILKACAGMQSLDSGVKIHSQIIKCGLGLDSFVGSALVDMYCKCGVMEDAQKLHYRIGHQTLVSSNAIISGFALQKQSEEAQKFFSQMLDTDLEPDCFTYATVLDTCANLATVGLGKQIHAQIIKRQLLKDVFISSTLVDMYAKCGSMNDSIVMFKRMENRDVVSWNALICGYAQHGFGLEALKMFSQMQDENIMPNLATFVAVLRACGHVGLFDEGIKYFNSMIDHYKLEPQLEHYSCMVDIIGRSKGIAEALKLINDMPFEADDIIWRTLLSVCKIHQNIEVAEMAANKLLMLDSEDSSTCILLSNVYASAGRWEKVSDMRRLMRNGNLKKEPGCSWIEVKNEMYTFLMGDKAHPRCKEIYERLDELFSEMKRAVYEPDMDLFLEQEQLP